MDWRVLSVGQCGSDDGRISRQLRKLGGFQFESAGDAQAARDQLASGQFDLVLVNRVFDADGKSGVDFIAELRKSNANLRVMLVSDYPEAQAAAVVHGAQLGFGKGALGSTEGRELLRKALADAGWAS